MFLIIDISTVHIVVQRIRRRLIVDNENIVKLSDDMTYNLADGCCHIRIPKKIATIKLCGALSFEITDTLDWKMPTDEQIKNLKEMLCIEVIPEKGD
jgi:hypothetical protein